MRCRLSHLKGAARFGAPAHTSLPLARSSAGFAAVAAGGLAVGSASSSQLLRTESQGHDFEQEFQTRKEEREREVERQAASLRAERRKHSERFTAAELAAQEAAAAEHERTAKVEELRGRIDRLRVVLKKERGTNFNVALGIAVRSIEGMLSESQELSEEDIQLLQDARDILDGLERAVRARLRFQAASLSLQQAVEMEDIALLRSSLRESDQAREDLAVCPEEVIPDHYPEEVKKASSLLSDLLKRQGVAEKQRAKRQRHLSLEADLLAAFREKSPQKCRDALIEAELAGLEEQSSKIMQLARAVAEPSRLHTALVHESPDRLAALRGCSTINGSFVGMGVDDFVTAAAEAAKQMDEKQLRARAEELAAAIVAHKNLLQHELADESKRAKEKLRKRCVGRAERSLQQFNLDRDRILQQRSAEMELAQQEATDLEIAELRGRLAAEVEEELQSLREVSRRQTDQRLSEERHLLETRLASIVRPVEAIEEIVAKGQSVGQRAWASNSLAAGTLRVADALVAGVDVQAELSTMQEACRSDSFVSRVLALLPEGTKDWSRGLVPTEPQLKMTFEDQLPDFVVAAFAPPQPSVENTTLLTGILSRLHAQLLARLFVLRASEAPEPELVSQAAARTPSEITYQNLQVLARASRLIRQGDMRDALAILDDMLSGACRERADEWMKDARNTLLLQQTSRALQAQAQCLNAALHSE